jgi:hypothetical protein
MARWDWDDIEQAREVADPSSLVGKALRAAFAPFRVAAPTGVAATDTANILAAANAARAAGGGKVLLRAGTYQLNSTLPVLPGVTYEGSPAVIAMVAQTRPSYTPDGYWTNQGGTILRGDGTFPCFAGNAATPNPLPVALGSTEINGAGIVNLSLEHFSYGIRIGAMDIAGLLWGRLDGLFIRDCTQWGVWLVNFQHVDIGTIRTSECGAGGQYYGDLITGTGPYYGNTVLRDIFHKSQNQRLSRGIVFEADGGVGAILNEMTIDRIQVNAYNRTQLTATATFTSGSTSVAVPDGSQFAVGLPVSFSATGNGFTANKSYQVQSVNGNTITLGASRSGAAISATASGTLTLSSWGMPEIEFVGRNAASRVSAVRVSAMDIEGASAAGLYMENTGGSVISITEVPIDSNIHVVGRNVLSTRIDSSPSATSDFDTTAGNSWFGNRSTVYGFPMSGMWRDIVSGTEMLAVGGGADQGNTGDIHRRYQNVLYPAAGMGERIVVRASNTNLDGTHCGDVISVLATDTTYTLPVISDATTTSNRVGVWYDIFNCGTGTITVTTQSSQLLNKVAAKTTTTIPPGTSAKFIACKDAVGAYFWAARAATLIS